MDGYICIDTRRANTIEVDWFADGELPDEVERPLPFNSAPLDWRWGKLVRQHVVGGCGKQGDEIATFQQGSIALQYKRGLLFIQRKGAERDAAPDQSRSEE